MDRDGFDYEQLVDAAMLDVVKKLLKQVSETGLVGRSHFFISFLSAYPGVQLSLNMRAKYPEEITIVLQHQFKGLVINRDSFSLRLSFSGVEEDVIVPFSAITKFCDPNVNFVLRFLRKLPPKEQNSATGTANIEKSKIVKVDFTKKNDKI